jgi:hypothetical protein
MIYQTRYRRGKWFVDVYSRSGHWCTTHGPFVSWKHADRFIQDIMGDI